MPGHRRRRWTPRTLVGVLGQPAGPAQPAAVRGGRPRRPGGQPAAGARRAAPGPHRRHAHRDGSRRRRGEQLPQRGLRGACSPPSAPLTRSCGWPAAPPRRSARHWPPGWGSGCRRPAPDELDQLVLDGAALTEAALETLFGLPATTGADPLRVPSTPQLLTWQLAGLALSWAEQDQHPNPPRAFAVLADPDVIGAPDVAPGPKGDPIRLLLAQRATQLAGYRGSCSISLRTGGGRRGPRARGHGGQGAARCRPRRPGSQGRARRRHQRRARSRPG